MSATFDTVRELARALPHVEDGGHAGARELRVKGKLLAWIRDDPIVLIRLSRIGRRQLTEVLEEARRQVAPKRMRAAYDAQHLGS